MKKALTTQTAPALERYTQFGMLILLALMPFHAFFSVWLGHMFGHEANIEAWKEALLLVLTALAALLAYREPTRFERLRKPWVIATVAFVIVTFLVTAVTRPPLTAIAFGFKTDLEFLLAAVIATLVTDDRFVRRAVTVVLATSGIVISFGLLELFVLPLNLLDRFGYGQATLMPYELISGTTTPRFASTLGGPNQLGTYLILPLCLSLALAVRRKQWWWLVLTTAGLVVLAGTYSRGAWVGAGLAIVLTLAASVPAHSRRWLLGGLAVTGVTATLVLTVAVSHSTRLRTYLFHQGTAPTRLPSSDAQHASSLMAGLHEVITNPIGHGAGTAGPATFHAGNLHIIEDYYLQLGYETGWLGALLFVMLFVLLIRNIWPQAPPIGFATAAALAGTGIVALVLPAWTDSSTALIAWTVAGSLAGLEKVSRHV